MFKQMLAKRALLSSAAPKASLNNMRQQINQSLLVNTKRQFSSGSAGGIGFGKTIALGVAGASLTGITYLSYMGHQMRTKATPDQ
jgi:hypothetical protein